MNENALRAKLDQIAFNSNGRDFYPETVNELIAFIKQERLAERIAELDIAFFGKEITEEYYDLRVRLLLSEESESSQTGTTN